MSKSSKPQNQIQPIDASKVKTVAGSQQGCKNGKTGEAVANT